MTATIGCRTERRFRKTWLVEVPGIAVLAKEMVRAKGSIDILQMEGPAHCL